jgi:hypothetical protein
MYKFAVNQTKLEAFQVVFWHLLVERFQETFDDQISEIASSLNTSIFARALEQVRLRSGADPFVS